LATVIQMSSRKTATRTKRDDSAAAAQKRIHSASKVGGLLKMCCYGRNKVGKTVFACSSDLKTLVIDCNEKGFDSVHKLPNVDIYEVRTWEDIDPIYWLLRGGEHEYKVIVIDTITMMAAVGMKWVLKDNYERDMNLDPKMQSSSFVIFLTTSSSMPRRRHLRLMKTKRAIPPQRPIRSSHQLRGLFYCQRPT